MKFRTRTLLLPLLAGTLIGTGCENTTGPHGAVEVRLSQSGQAMQSLSPAALLSTASVDGTPISGISLSSVSSIWVSVARVEVLRKGVDENDAGEWVSLNLATAGEIDLRALPEGNGVVIAAGNLPDGEYGNLRLFIDGATIAFSGDVTIGSTTNARVLTAGDYDLRIPSSMQTGIKVPVSFTVSRSEAGEEVTVEFDGSASVQSLQFTAQGTVQMSPVLTSKSK